MTLDTAEITRLLDERGVDEAAMELHRALRGKVASRPRAKLTEGTLELQLLYTQGVGAVGRALAPAFGAINLEDVGARWSPTAAAVSARPETISTTPSERSPRTSGSTGTTRRRPRPGR